MLLGIYPQLGDQQRVIFDLETLSRVNLTELEAADPEFTYLFKHVITQEVTYESLPYATRAVLHEEVGKLIEHSSPDMLDPYIDLLAFHYERSNNEAKKRPARRTQGNPIIVERPTAGSYSRSSVNSS